MGRRFTLPPWLVAAFILASGAGIVALAAQVATDSPETGSMRQRGGAKCESERIQGYEAKEAAIELTRGKAVRIAHAYGPDRYGRMVVDLEVDGIDIALALVAEGPHKPWDYDGGDPKPDWCAGPARVPAAP